MGGRGRHHQPEGDLESGEERTTRNRDDIHATADVTAEVLVTGGPDELGTAEQIAYAQALATVSMVGRLDQLMWQLETPPPRFTEDLMDRLDQMAQELRWIRDTAVSHRV